MKWTTLGLEKNKVSFESIIAEDRLGHAYLFWGEDMIGKRTFAVELCARINNHSAGNAYDTKTIAPRASEGETKIYIEDARDLKTFLSLKPIFGRRRITIIDDADRLTPEATNAILKVLEEPPSLGLLILISSKPKALPQTIYSRCHHVHFANNSPSVVSTYLDEAGISGVEAEFLTRIGRGRIGWMARVIENKQTEKIMSSIAEFEKVITMGVFEKMIYAKSLTERDNRLDVLNDFIYYFSSDNDFKRRHAKTLRGLLRAYTLISQPQYNHRLVLENFVLSM
jgi:DNA polymerase-3 subunit delta'